MLLIQLVCPRKNCVPSLSKLRIWFRRNMANFFTSASTNFVLDHQLSPRRLSTSSHHVEFRDMPRRLSAHVEFRDLPCSHIDGHLQPPPHLYHRRRSSDVSHDRRHHHHHHKEVHVLDFWNFKKSAFHEAEKLRISIWQIDLMVYKEAFCWNFAFFSKNILKLSYFFGIYL